MAAAAIPREVDVVGEAIQYRRKFAELSFNNSLKAHRLDIAKELLRTTATRAEKLALLCISDSPIPPLDLNEKKPIHYIAESNDIELAEMTFRELTNDEKLRLLNLPFRFATTSSFSSVEIFHNPFNCIIMSHSNLLDLFLDNYPPHNRAELVLYNPSFLFEAVNKNDLRYVRSLMRCIPDDRKAEYLNKTTDRAYSRSILFFINSVEILELLMTGLNDEQRTELIKRSYETSRTIGPSIHFAYEENPNLEVRKRMLLYLPQSSCTLL